MTRKKKKTTIITETDRVLIINRRSGEVEGWCDDCSDLAGMVRPEESGAWAAFRLGSAYQALALKDLARIKPGVVDVSPGPWLKPA